MKIEGRNLQGVHFAGAKKELREGAHENFLLPL